MPVAARQLLARFECDICLKFISGLAASCIARRSYATSLRETDIKTASPFHQDPRALSRVSHFPDLIHTSLLATMHTDVLKVS